MARVDLVVPTFNGTDLLLACLKTVVASTWTDYRLIVVDDGSDVPVNAQVHEIVPDATIIRFETNHGLTTAFNTAISAGDSEFAVLLNNDTEVEPEWLGNLVECADRHPAAGSVASKLMLASDRSRIHSAGDTWAVWGMPGNRGVWLEDFGQYDAEAPVFGACAGAALYRRTALDAVRLENGDWFDTRLFMYCEDVDLSWRLQTAGFSCVFAPDAVVYHHLSATGGGSLASFFVSRNVWKVMAHTVPSEVLRMNRWRIAAFHSGRFTRNLTHIREEAARRSIAGTVAGVGYFLGHVFRRRLSPHRADKRVLNLLVDR